MSRRGLKRSQVEQLSSDSLVNLTPLIDVVFVVLICFILIAPLLKMDKIDLAPASIKSTQEDSSLQSKQVITIKVFDNNKISINNREVEERELLAVLINLKKNYPSEIPRLFQDQKAYFGTYQIVKNALEQAGFEELDIVLKP